jgi:hypothetical protein
MPSKPKLDPLAGRAELVVFLRDIGQGARDELLLGLQAPAHARQAIIAECLATEDARDLGEFLQKLERDPEARAEVIDAIREFYEQPPAFDPDEE